MRVGIRREVKMKRRESEGIAIFFSSCFVQTVWKEKRVKLERKRKEERVFIKSLKPRSMA